MTPAPSFPVRRALAAIAYSLALAACADQSTRTEVPWIPQGVLTPGYSGPGVCDPPTLAAHESRDIHVSILWEGYGSDRQASAARELSKSEARATLRVDHGTGLTNQVAPAVELEFDVPAEEFDSVMGRLAQPAASVAAAGPSAHRPMDPLAGPWDRRALLGVEPTNIDGGTRWHASVLADPADFERVKRAFEKLRNGFEGLEHRAAPAATLPSSGPDEVGLFDSRASLPTEIRWVPPAQASSAASAEQRAIECVTVAALAHELEGWTYVPAAVDLGGWIEPACLYTSADYATAKVRFDALRAAIGTARAPKNAAVVLAERIAFARAQLEREDFRLHALHGSELPRFEAEFLVLQKLSADLSPAPDLAKGGWWSVVGPRLGWSSVLAEIGDVRLHRPQRDAEQDALLEDDLARMWAALGGVERWRDLKTLRVLGVLTPKDGNSRQGVEQWVDFNDGRFALSQAVGPVETVIAATPTQAWILDGSSGVELEPAQASKFRGRQERTWFAVLRRLAQPDRDGLTIVRENERFLLLEGARALCWIEVGDAGSLVRLGYQLDEYDSESIYEFHDWRIDGPLAYPARMLQLDRNATFEIQHIEPGAKLDPLLWVRKKR